MGATAAIGAIGASQTYGQINALRDEGRYQRNVYENNAKLSEFSAEDALIRGEREAQATNRKTRQVIGSQRAALAAQGIEVDSGTALDVQTDTAAIGALDAMTIRNNAWREAWGYKVQAQDYRSKAEFTRIATKRQIRNTILTGLFNTGSSGLSTYAGFNK